jgi:lysozyme family protein
MDNLGRWNRAKFTRSTDINKQAARIEANRARYEAVAKKTGVPWDVIGVVHYRESAGSFAGVLHNGQKIIGTGKKTTIVPKGRGPFSTWEDAAVDALMNCAPYAGKNKDWSIGGTLDLLERYNGLGYRNKGLPSPYLWAGTDQYVKGKYVADGKFDPNYVDKQLGVAPILMKLREDEKPAQPAVEAPKPVPAAPVTPPKPQPAPAPAPVAKTPPKTGIAMILALIGSGALIWWHDITSWIGSLFQ